MHIRLLGPLEVTDERGEAVALVGERERALLAALALQAPAPVSASRLIDVIWGDEPPATATNALQVHVSKLRKRLGAASIVSTPGGYALDVPADRVDAIGFERLVGTAAADPQAESLQMSGALAMWRGDALTDVFSDALEGERVRLEELRLLALDRRIDADLALGRHDALVAELEVLVRLDPLREAPRRQLMLALYRAGRQAAALATYRDLKEQLSDSLGIDPSPSIQALEVSILQHDPTLGAPVPGSAATPAATSPIPGQRGRTAARLPAQLSAFVGRAREMEELATCLAGSRLVTITGTGGSGKTRLALEVASQVPADAGGAWFVDLAAVEASELVAATFAQALCILDTSGWTTEETLVREIGDRSTFVVLDNCEHVLDACAKLCFSLLRSCRGLRILATSREPLNLDGEHVFRLGPMEVPPVQATASTEAIAAYDGVRLFVDRAAAHTGRFSLDDANAPAVASLCRRLDGIPLAIELAAARLRGMSVDDIAARLDDRFRLLRTGRGAVLPRQQTLEATIDWSYDLLNELERALLGRLSVFVDGWDLAAAEAVCSDGSVDDVEVAELLSQLVDRSLVQTVRSAGRLRYRLLDSVRQYAAMKDANVRGAGNLRRRHFEHYLELAERAKEHWEAPDEPRWMERLSQDHQNLHAAMEYAIARVDEPDLALRLAGALAWYWRARGHYEEACGLLARTLSEERPGGEATRRTALLMSLGRLLYYSGHIAEAERRLLEAHECATASKDFKGALASLHGLSDIAFRRGDVARARTVAEQAVALASTDGDAEDLAGARHMRAAILDYGEEGALARSDLCAAHDYYRATGNLSRATSILVNLCDLELESGDCAAASRYLEEGASLADETGSVHSKLHVMSMRPMVALLQHQAGRATETATAYVAAVRDAGAEYLRHGSILAAALAASCRGDEGTAAQLHGAADSLANSLEESFDPLETRLLEEDRTRIRSSLGEAAFEQLFAAGASLSYEEMALLAAAGTSAATSPLVG